MAGEHTAPKHEIDDPNKRRREKHTPVGIIRRPLQLPPMEPIKNAFDSDEDYEIDELLGDELAKVEEQIG
jgi:hypothetical protein